MFPLAFRGEGSKGCLFTVPSPAVASLGTLSPEGERGWHSRLCFAWHLRQSHMPLADP
ncbi:hypothetical protein SPHS6_02221 [Sphingobium sp. S6]|jgi:hypothetical protein|nr:hypothetical protein SPHS8_01832 [Sphingobium sp. S8]CAD7338976.1 hypothetical protein SPHS6_02221 [Sphingobium sp. S6]